MSYIIRYLLYEFNPSSFGARNDLCKIVKKLLMTKPYLTPTSQRTVTQENNLISSPSLTSQMIGIVVEDKIQTP